MSFSVICNTCNTDVQRDSLDYPGGGEICEINYTARGSYGKDQPDPPNKYVLNLSEWYCNCTPKSKKANWRIKQVGSEIDITEILLNTL